MAAYTKGSTSLSSAQSVAAATPADSTNTATVTTQFSFSVFGNITNGATGPTVGLTAQLMVSADNSTFFVADQVTGLLGNNTVTPFAFNYIGDAVQYIKMHYLGNTVQAVTVTAVLFNGTGFA
jgi:hypothetical protein